MSEVFKGLSRLPNAPLIEGDMYADLWRYRTQGERTYVSNMCALLAESLEAWWGRFLVHADTICWQRAIFVSHFRYEDRSSSSYWNYEVKWKRRILSPLGRFVPYHLLCSYNLTEAAINRLFVFIPEHFRHLKVCHGLKCEQKPIFSCKSTTLLDDRESGLLVVAYTENVLRVCAVPLVAVYAVYRLWHVPPDIIGFARNLVMNMSVALGSRAIVRKVLELMEVIESTRFEAFPNAWGDCTLRTLHYHPGRVSTRRDFVYYDPSVSLQTMLRQPSSVHRPPVSCPMAYSWGGWMWIMMFHEPAGTLVMTMYCYMPIKEIIILLSTNIMSILVL